MLTPQICAEIIRQRLSLPDDSQAARIIAQIPTALKAFARKVAADPNTRQNVITDRTTTTLPITTGGRVDMNDGYGDYKFMLEYLDQGFIYLLISTPISGVRASGEWEFVANPDHNETIAVNGVTFTFKLDSATVSGAGTAAANGVYTVRGTANGKPYYNLVGQADNVAQSSIWWNSVQWTITSAFATDLYFATDDVAFPWLVPGWTADNGSNPTPTVAHTTLSAVEVLIGDTNIETAENFANTLNASVNASITVATYAAEDEIVTGTYDTDGTTGNSFTMADSSLTSVQVSGATFTGGTGGIDVALDELSISAYLTSFDDLDAVYFTTSGVLPTGIEADTTYYIVNYAVAGGLATFQLSTTPDGLHIVNIEDVGSGVLTINKDTSDDAPLQRLTSPQQAVLPQYLSEDYNYFYVQSGVLTLVPHTLSGNLAFSVPAYPTTLAGLPDDESSEKLFLDLLFETVAVMPPR